MPDTPADLLLILAMDHRDSLEKELYKLSAAPTPGEAARIAADKLLVYRALLDVTMQLPAGTRPGILVDEEYGASVAELAAADSAVDLAMPIEASGHPWFQFAFPGDWQGHAEFFATDHSKVLIRDNPGLDASDRSAQMANVATVSAWATTAGRPLIVELLIPATEADLESVGGDALRYDTEVRPRLTVQVIRELQDAGVEPALWKVEGLETTAAAQAIAEVAHRDGRTAQCIVLGRHAPTDRLEHWLEAAAPVADFVGFAIGRSIWWDALTDHLAGAIDEREAQKRISAAYLQFATDFAAARTAAGV
jgi:5-dehydro-2-deoxygluconokinase